jgi:4-amino-4-deoxychorismate lyase
MSNLFAVIDGVLCTPDLRDAGVDGILRGLVLERASRFAPCRVTALTRAELERADELFLTNSLIGVWPVAVLEQRRLAVGALTRRVQEALRDGYIGE